MNQPEHRGYPFFGAQRAPTPWAAGLTTTVIVATLTTCGVYSFSAALAEVHPLLAIVVNLVAVGGAAPTAWRARWTPVTRWVVAGIAIGIPLGWAVLLVAALST